MKLIEFAKQKCLGMDRGERFGCGLTFTLQDLRPVTVEGVLVGFRCADCDAIEQSSPAGGNEHSVASQSLEGIQ